MSLPIPLSDTSMTMLMVMAEPLAVVDRGPFLERVAERLQAEPTIGDGIVARIARDEQAKLLRPMTSWETTPGRWGRVGRPRKAALGLRD
jgi:hypothetical protein